MGDGAIYSFKMDNALGSLDNHLNTKMTSPLTGVPRNQLNNYADCTITWNSTNHVSNFKKGFFLAHAIIFNTWGAFSYVELTRRSLSNIYLPQANLN